MVPGKVIPFRGPRRHRLRGKRAPVKVGYYQRVQSWLGGNATRGAVLAGVVVGLIFGAFVTMAVLNPAPPAPEAVVETLG